MIIKKVVVALAMISVMAACNSKPKEVAVVVDTTAIKQKAIFDEQARVTSEEEARQKLALEKRREHRRENEESASSSNVGNSGTPVNAGSGTSSEAAPAKKGWSSAAKSTAIGAGAGAIAGGIIGHNLGGAAIGAAVGGGTGYLIGRAKDRKSGRVVKKVKPVKPVEPPVEQ